MTVEHFAHNNLIHLAISAFGADQPGVIAALTDELQRCGANLEDAKMTRLRGHFAMVVVVAVPDEGANFGAQDDPAAAGVATLADHIAHVLRQRMEPMGLSITVQNCLPVPTNEEEGIAVVVAVHGADRPGIVRAVTSTLAELGVNVDDLSTRLLGDGDNQVYSLVLDASLPAGGVDVDELRARLGETANNLGVTVTVHLVDGDVM